MSELTPKQDLFLAYLFNDPECAGDVKLAAKKAGYESPQEQYRVSRALKNEILERSQMVLAMQAPKAASKLINMMDEDGSTPKGELRLKAIESTLDRVGVAKKQEIDITGSDGVGSAIFFIPQKQAEQPVQEEDQEN